MPRHDPTTLPISPIAVDELRDRCSGNASIALLLLEKFEQQLAQNLASIETQVQRGDGAALARTAHALKGAAGAVAAGAVYTTITEIESLARANRLDSIFRSLESLRANVDQCVRFLPAARQALSSSPTSRPSPGVAP